MASRAQRRLSWVCIPPSHLRALLSASAILLANIALCAQPSHDPETFQALLSAAAGADSPLTDPAGVRPRVAAVEKLGGWPEVSAEDEKRIAEVLLAGAADRRKPLNYTCANALGHRGHSEAIPRIIEIGELDPMVIVVFFGGLSGAKAPTPAPSQLRPGLASANPRVRSAILEGAGLCKVTDMLADVRDIFEREESPQVRSAAVRAYWKLKATAPASRVSRADQTAAGSSGGAPTITPAITDSDVPLVLPILADTQQHMQPDRQHMLERLSSADLANSTPVCDALLDCLNDSSHWVRLAAIKALVHFHDTRVIARIRENLDQRRPPWEEALGTVEALTAFGGEDAIETLNKMLSLGFGQSYGVEQALVKFGAPSSARVAWAMYLKDPVRTGTEDVAMVGHHQALTVVAACADADLLPELRARWKTARDYYEESRLGDTIRKIEARLGK